MPPKFMEDEDGDVPPCGVEESYEMAKEWDREKQLKYKGKQKAKSVVSLYHPHKVNLWVRFQQLFRKQR